MSIPYFLSDWRQLKIDFFFILFALISVYDPSGYQFFVSLLMAPLVI